MPVSRRALISAFAATTAFAGMGGAAWAQSGPDATVLDTMKRATRFMVDEAAVNGGYVWSYLPDF